MLRPLCLPYYYVGGRKVPVASLWPKGVGANGITHTSDGFLLPCCWCPAKDGEFAERGFFEPSLNLINNDSVEDILSTTVWRSFIDTLYFDPENAPKLCQRKCGMQDGC